MTPNSTQVVFVAQGIDKQERERKKRSEKKRQALEAYKKRMWDRYRIKVELDD